MNSFGRIQRTNESPVRKHGFTLIELLVVIAIIAILASILFPVFSRARENARRSSCQSNLKQIGLGIMQYTQDYDESMPYMWADYVPNYTTTTTSNIAAAIYPYTKSWQILACPSATPYSGGYAPAIPDNVNRSSYLYNAVMTISPSMGPRSIASVPEPANIIVAQDAKDIYGMVYLQPKFGDLTGNDSFYYEWLLPGYNDTHFDGGNLLFFDGHVKWRKPSTICMKEYGLSGSQCGYQSSISTAATALF